MKRKKTILLFIALMGSQIAFAEYPVTGNDCNPEVPQTCKSTEDDPSIIDLARGGSRGGGRSTSRVAGGFTGN